MTPQKLTQEELKTLEAQAASNDIAEIMSFNQHGEDNAIKLLAHIRALESDLDAAQRAQEQLDRVIGYVKGWRGDDRSLVAHLKMILNYKNCAANPLPESQP